MDKFTATKVFRKQRFTDQERQMVEAINLRLTALEQRTQRRKSADHAHRLKAKMSELETQVRELCRRRGVSFDSIARDHRTADAKALDAARQNLTGKAPRTADESNHLSALAAKQRADVQRTREINEANAQRGIIKDLLAKALAAVS